MSDDQTSRRRGAQPYSKPASHKGYSAYSRETYVPAELEYRGRVAQTEKEKKCDKNK